MDLPQVTEQSSKDPLTHPKPNFRPRRHPKVGHSKMRSKGDVKGKKREQVDGNDSISPQSNVPPSDAEPLSSRSESPALSNPTPTPTSDASVSTSVCHGSIKPKQGFSAFGIDAYRTRALSPQICLNWVFPGTRCPKESRCPRIHPKDREYYFRKMGDALSIGSSADSGNRSLLAELDSQSPIPPSASESIPRPQTPDKSPPKQPTSTPRSPGWDPNTGNWDFGLDQTAWSMDDSSSSVQSEETCSTISKNTPSLNSSDTEDDNQIQSRHKSPIPRFVREPCLKFQRGQCFRGFSCRYYHEVQAPQTTLEVSKFPSTGIGTPSEEATHGSGNNPSLPPTAPKVRYPLPPYDDVCQKSLRGQCHQGPLCYNIHEDVEYDRSIPRREKPRRQIPQQIPQQAYNPPRFQALLCANPPPPNIKPRYPRPPFDDVCQDSLRGDCRKGHLCDHVHQDVEYDESMPRRQAPEAPKSQASSRADPQPPKPKPRFPRPPFDELCQGWLLRDCQKGHACDRIHRDVEYDESIPRRQPPQPPKSEASSRVEAPPPKPQTRHPRPPFDEVCHSWLRGNCQRGHKCNRIHRNVEYDESIPRRKLPEAPRSEASSRADPPPPPKSKTLYPRPPFDEVCPDWLRGDCQKGHSCNRIHRDVDYDESIPRRKLPKAPRSEPSSRAEPPAPAKSKSRYPHPPLDEVCPEWLRSRCQKGHSCDRIHRDVEYDESIPRRQLPKAPRSQAPSRADPSKSTTRYPRPPYDDVCRDWLRGECSKGHHCNHIHQDVEYDDSIPRRQLIQVPPRVAPEIFSTTIYKHIRIKVTDGCEITEVTTGFETSWIYIGNVPRLVKQDQLAELLQSHGELIDLRIPKSASPFVTAKARFSSAAEASRLCTVLNGLEAFGSILTAKLTINASSTASNTHLHDTTVRVSWEAPSKTAYAGFSTEEASLKALEKARYTPMGKHLLRATVHKGLPAVGRFNIRFDGVPAATNSEEMKAYCDAQGIMWGKTNHTSHDRALHGVQRMLKDSGAELLDFDVMPPPYRKGMIVGWAHLASSADAKKLCDYMDGRKPVCTGLTRVFAKHIHSLEYSLNPGVYADAKKDIEALAATAWRMERLSVSCRPHLTYVAVRLDAEDTESLSKLKGELDVILSGEVVRDNGKVVWHGFITSISGQQFISSLERQYAPLKISVDRVRRVIRLFGVSVERLAARMKILEKVEELRKQQVHTIPLDARMFGVFMNDGLKELQSELGEDAVHLDLWNRALTVRGPQNAYDTALDAVVRARRAQHTTQLPNMKQCPVCFDQVSSAITLCCGHSWCKTCLIRFMMTAVDQKFFPLTCLGDDGKCQEKIPLGCARQLLPAADFEALIEAAFSAHVNHHLDEFCFCPTPDCPQIYRKAPRVEVPKPPPKSQKKSGNTADTPASSVSVGTVLQCPSCLVRICASCQTEAHDGLVCVRPEEGDSLFDEWMKNNDVKPCPGCKMPIEKAMGCHHVTCTVCSTHLCWVCLMPFHNGAGVYSHMLAIHGSFV